MMAIWPEIVAVFPPRCIAARPRNWQIFIVGPLAECRKFVDI